MLISDDLVFITGATGFVGSSTLLHLLGAGYRVRAAVRSKAEIASILAQPQIQALSPGPRLTFAVVPDITVAGAYDDAIEEATHAIHIASPTPSGGEVIPPEQHIPHFFSPAAWGTLNMLEAANKAGTVRRVVITSSIMALAPLEEVEGTQPRSPEAAITPKDRTASTLGPWKSTFAAYAASKVSALREAETWLENEKHGFDVVHLFPGFVLGRNESATTAAEAMRCTNSLLLGLLLGGQFGPRLGFAVHIDDVSRAHVEALNPQLPGNRGFILGQPVWWDDAIDIAKRVCPDAFESRMFVDDGSVVTTHLPVDTSETEVAFGFKLANLEDMVKSVLGQFLTLRAAEGAQGASTGVYGDMSA
ncbi:putative NADPH-dependent methylglyoxal reductase GRP2 [Achaetomium macrosporum]|uniref:NADPH-dependent methylglyoxal reductase GRP2 n=1 Tax=Achaetomium macrosporum TaxID=79813 RepID=A0AAN7CD29_9PEZI|nr:putative NADPH-dependent methylglyoxal reductase GRP2 [Achaetomium macrosporum]